ncbi:hypothetical protein PZB74_10635 [Porifericola rhodea]|uniref:YEATS-associated helix-containing protein n=1 Tax=Porifericola rhodea TaxID=930972 RepID=UPI002665F157|nr:YEATS-associated helix-containing protein [Porifericola rhodea]WKN33780.1 hypothetical protein PZB74_10635 [Porifericola rhodea]
MEDNKIRTLLIVIGSILVLTLVTYGLFVKEQGYIFLLIVIGGILGGLANFFLHFVKVSIPDIQEKRISAEELIENPWVNLLGYLAISIAVSFLVPVLNAVLGEGLLGLKFLEDKGLKTTTAYQDGVLIGYCVFVSMLAKRVLFSLAERVLPQKEPKSKTSDITTTSSKEASELSPLKYLLAQDARTQINDNLQDNGNNEYSSRLEVGGVNCSLAFPANCWESARGAGHSNFREVLNKWTDRSFNVLSRFVNEEKISHITFSGIWRPQGVPHSSGRGIDITIMERSNDRVVFNRNQGDNTPEPDLAKSLTNWWKNSGKSDINQFLGPWQICEVNQCVANNGSLGQHQNHLNHLHLTVNS